MKKFSINSPYYCVIIAWLLVIGHIQAIPYGWTGLAGQSSTTAYYNNKVTIFGDGDTIAGPAHLAGGFHTSGSASSSGVSFNNVAFPIEKDIYIQSGDRINILGDLTLSTTSIGAGGDFDIYTDTTYSSTLFLAKDTILPPVSLWLHNNLTIDGQGNTLTFQPDTTFYLMSPLTLKNMVINGLSDNFHFRNFTEGTALNLQNCIINLAPNTAFNCGYGGPVYITNDVIVHDGTISVGYENNLRVNPFSTLHIEFSSMNFTGNIIMADATSTIHINEGALQAGMLGELTITGTSVINTGKLLFENNCNINTYHHFSTIDLSAANVVLSAGACTTINGNVII